MTLAVKFPDAPRDGQIYGRQSGLWAVVNASLTPWTSDINGAGYQLTNVAGASITNFLGGTWIDMPTSGASGIGSGGAGSNAWLAYASGVGFWFSDSQVGDVCYRNAVGHNILMGIDNGGGNAQSMFRIENGGVIHANGTFYAVGVTDHNNYGYIQGSNSSSGGQGASMRAGYSNSNNGANAVISGGTSNWGVSGGVLTVSGAVGTSPGGVFTNNNTLDDGSGNATFAGGTITGSLHVSLSAIVGEVLTTMPVGLTYNGSGQLTGVSKTGGSSKTLSYNTDGTLNTLFDGTRTKTFNWVSGVLQSVSVV